MAAWGFSARRHELFMIETQKERHSGIEIVPGSPAVGEHRGTEGMNPLQVRPCFAKHHPARASSAANNTHQPILSYFVVLLVESNKLFARVSCIRRNTKIHIELFVLQGR
jgi:hypothetical protein